MSQTLQAVIVLGVVICIVGSFLGPGFRATAAALGGTLIGGALVIGYLIAHLVMVFVALLLILAIVAVVALIRWLLNGRRRNRYRSDRYYRGCDIYRDSQQGRWCRYRHPREGIRWDDDWFDDP